MADVLVSGAIERISETPRFSIYGRVTRVVGRLGPVEVVGLDAGVGDICRVQSLTDASRTVLVEVVGFHEHGVVVMPFADLTGMHLGASVVPLGRSFSVGVGAGLLGRVIDPLGKPMEDGSRPLELSGRVPLSAEPSNPLQRSPVSEVFETGVRAIDGVLTLGRGQRVGIFAGSGVGKSTLLGMIARNSSAEVNVIALVGERNREVQEFLDKLGPDGLTRSVVVVATGDKGALLRLRCAYVATAIAEYFRDEGKHVLLMMDSVTRVAHAWREIGLAAGEPPTSKGYPPSMVPAMQQLLERSGNGVGTGGITALYTVLVDGENFDEPVADATRSILDGHIVLTSALADADHYPAIDVLKSKSRVRDQVISTEHRHAAGVLTKLEAAYRDKEPFIIAGEYDRGSSPVVDAAIDFRAEILRFLQQDAHEGGVRINDTRRALFSLASRADAALAAGVAA